MKRFFVIFVLCFSCGKKQEAEEKEVLKPDRFCIHGAPESRGIYSIQNVIARDRYSIGYSYTGKIPIWVCETLRADDMSDKSTKRSSFSFKPDPDIIKSFQAKNEDYLGSGYHRGHMVPYADREDMKDEAERTFYLSNVTPQKPSLNKVAWYGIEDYLRKLAKRCQRVDVISGVIFDKSKPKVLGKSNVWIPDAFYKVIVRGSVGIAVIVENKDYPPGYKWHQSAKLVSIKLLEKRTGINFMPKIGLIGEKLTENKRPFLGMIDNCGVTNPIIPMSEDKKTEGVEQEENKMDAGANLNNAGKK